MNQKTTDELMKILDGITTRSQLSDYADELSASGRTVSFTDYINGVINEHNTNAAAVIRDSLIQRNYGYQILNGSRKPSRDKIIALCVSLKLGSDETNRALTIAGEGRLYSKNRRDSIIIFALNKCLGVMELNELLCDMGESILD